MVVPVLVSSVNGIDPVPVIVSDSTWIHDAVAEADQVQLWPVAAVTVNPTALVIGCVEEPGSMNAV
jgi:hypothetical protein